MGIWSLQAKPFHLQRFLKDVSVKDPVSILLDIVCICDKYSTNVSLSHIVLHFSAFISVVDGECVELVVGQTPVVQRES